MRATVLAATGMIASIVCTGVTGCGGSDQSQSRCALPSAGSGSAQQLTVDDAGNVFFSVKSSIMKSASGAKKSSTISVPPIKGDAPSIRALAADSTGDVYAATASPDSRSIEDREYELLRIPADSTSATAMPNDVGAANGLAVDRSGTIYASGHGIQMLASASSKPSKIYSGGRITTGIAVDQSGSIYVIELPQNHTDRGGQVLKLQSATSTPQSLPFTVDGWPVDIAVDRAGDVFLAQNTENIAKGPEVQKLTAGASTATKLTLDGVKSIRSLAADAGHLYINQQDEITKLSLDGKCQ